MTLGTNLDVNLDVNLLVQPDGTLHCVYDESIDLAAFGQLSITRGSHVEPATDGRWYADLAPVSGPKLGPFARRCEALAAERLWLQQHWLTRFAKSTQDDQDRPSDNRYGD